MRFSEVFGIVGTQAQFDFLDVPVQTDIRLFLDPFSIVMTDTGWAREAHGIVTDFFQTVLNRLRAGDRDGAIEIVVALHEDNRTHTGFCKTQSKGKAFSLKKAAALVDSIAASEAFKTGIIKDIEDTSLLVAGVGIDLVSDIMANVLREKLADYTADQCELHGLPLSYVDKFAAWRKGQGWVSVNRLVPFDGTKPILLVPRSLVREELSLKPEQFITAVLDGADHGETDPLAALRLMLKTPVYKENNSIDRTDARKRLKQGGTKNAAARLANADHGTFDRFKANMRARRRAVTVEDIERLQPSPLLPLEKRVANENISAAMLTPADQQSAVTSLRMVLSAVHPLLQHPRKVRNAPKGFVGALLASTLSSGPFAIGGATGGAGGDVLVLSTSEHLSHKSLGFDWKALRESLHVQRVLILGESLSDKLQADRKNLAKSGMYFASNADISDLNDFEGGAVVAAQVLENRIVGH